MRLVYGLVGVIVLLLGLILLVVAAKDLTPEHSDTISGVVLAELGAVLIALGSLHLIYELFGSRRHRDEMLEAIKDLFEKQTEFTRCGFGAALFRLSAGQLAESLAGAKKIRVLKTWFPDSAQIEDGLRDALRREKCEIELFLCQPKSELLHIRSKSADYPPDEGERRVYQALRIVASPDTKAKVKVVLYDSWPGCPVISYDAKYFVGFYLRGKTSPHFPWIELVEGSELMKEILWQFKSLRRLDNTIAIESCDELRDWLKKNESGGKKTAGMIGRRVVPPVEIL